MRDNERAGLTVLTCGMVYVALYILGTLALLGGIIFVVLHFLARVW